MGRAINHAGRNLFTPHRTVIPDPETTMHLHPDKNALRPGNRALGMVNRNAAERPHDRVGTISRRVPAHRTIMEVHRSTAWRSERAGVAAIVGFEEAAKLARWRVNVGGMSKVPRVAHRLASSIRQSN